ncbi:universal stress protein UspA [Halobiforma lacisalsi AJ5]|uniref:Universal stress protein UspA n=1 Tax=Natronobacterium lacisalsi AJ5 TaxID=358396 RepID=M0LPR4_NATLA|nr:universal stress protein [Halobiforma lacisalsi]APW99667.1 universal stress protein UspA [Halobiforma lacisalsi AJ5]EMA35542.1 UspA domain-containing protein [Halobiforma lacisalsi AJ5]
MYDAIVVATDGSETGTAAVDHAIGLASRFGANLFGLTVLESRTDYDNAIVDPEEVDRRRREQAEEIVADLESAAAEAGVDVETAVESGVPYEEIIAAAKARDADAIVVGSRGRSSFKRALLGGTVDAVVRYADRPVVVVDGPDEDGDGSETGNDSVPE